MTVVIAALFVWSAIAPYSLRSLVCGNNYRRRAACDFCLLVAQFQIFHNFLCYFRGVGDYANRRGALHV